MTTDYLGIVIYVILLTIGFHYVVIRFIALIYNRQTAKQKQQRGVSDNDD